jgi:anti-anti-sigma factor
MKYGSTVGLKVWPSPAIRCSTNRARLRPLWERADLGAVVLDMAELEFCDSVGVGEIIAAMKRSDAAGKRFMLSGVHGVLARVLTLTGLRRAFEVHAGADAAVRAALPRRRPRVGRARTAEGSATAAPGVLETAVGSALAPPAESS